MRFWLPGSRKGSAAIPVMLITTALIFSACNPFSASEKSGSGIAEDGLEIFFSEHVERERSETTPAELKLLMRMSTKKIMPCMNYQISFRLSDYGRKPRVRDIRLLSYGLPGQMCLTALGPAIGKVDFDRHKGSYRLLIRDGDLKDSFDLEITDEYVRVVPDAATFTRATHDVYYRRPENSFYFVCGTTNDMGHLCDDFHHKMKGELTVSEFTFPDDGWIPYPEKSSGNHYNHPTRYYTYDNVEQFHRAGELLEQFTHDEIGDKQGISLSIMNWIDEGYRSWQMQSR
ncbi:hypothetical protein [Natronogracilivirga saccharolytica]|nr:hypothetical protein [Natronogracilivirga saccharolytica]